MVKVSMSPVAVSCGFTVFFAGGLDDDHGMGQTRRAHQENS